MRIRTITGVALIIVAAFVFFGTGFTSQRNVMDVGGMTVTTEEHHSIQPWIAGLMLLAGAALLLTDTRRRKA